MKKIFLVLILISTLAFSAWSDYQPITWEDLNDIILSSKKGSTHKVDEIYFAKPYKVKVILNAYPEKTADKDIVDAINIYRKAYKGNSTDETFASAYSLRIVMNGKKYILVFQDIIVPYLINEVNLGESIELYVLLAHHNALLDQTLLFVNEFSSEKSNKADDLKDKADALFDAEEYEEALKVLEEVLAIYPEHSSANYNKGLCLIRMKKYKEALPCFDIVISQNANDAGANFQIGVCYEYLTQLDQAINYFNKTISLDPRLVRSYYERACCFFDQKKYNESIADYKQCIALDRDNAGIYNFSIACAESMQGNISSALNYLRLAKETGYVNKDDYLNSSFLKNVQNAKEFNDLVSDM